MKNIEEILKDAGVEVTAEQLTAINTGVKDNYRTVADYDKQKEKLTTSEDKVKTLTASLDKFKDVDPDALNAEITKLKDQLTQKDDEYAKKISERDFEDLVKTAITSAKGKNAKAIRALLDLDTLKASKNQKDDIATALKTLSEAEDSKMLFDAGEDDPVGKVDAIGKIGQPGAGSEYENSLRSAMGLEPIKKS